MTNGPRRAPQVTRKEDRGGRREPDWTHYRVDVAAPDRPDLGPMIKPGIEMSVQHDKDWDDYAYPNPSGANFGFSGKDLNTDAPGGQMKLFGHAHSPGESKIDYLRSTKNARIHAPALLALANQDLARTHPGRTMDASEDRSKFSENLVDRLGGSLGTQFSERTSTNNIPWLEQGLDSWHTVRGDKFPDEELVSGGEWKAAQQTIRNTLRPPVQGPKKPDHEQGTLF